MQAILSKFNWSNGVGLIIIHLAALLALWPGFFSWSALIVVAGISYLTGALGVTLGYHRTLTHRSLRMIRPLEYLVALLGTLAMQGDPISWVATHRAHHAHSDHKGDPHTVRLGLTWAHMHWLLGENRHTPTGDEMKRLAPDLYAQPFYRFLKYANIPLQVALGLVLLHFGGWSWVVWGIFVRLVLTYHSTWLVNSASHSSGYRTYRTGDRSTNSWWVALLSFGEGWHNNHHAFPYSARHGMAWWEIDMTWWHIKFLRFLGLADKVRVPSIELRERFRLSRPQSTIGG
jgi:fatty-acid desaturase